MARPIKNATAAQCFITRRFSQGQTERVAAATKLVHSLTLRVLIGRVAMMRYFPNGQYDVLYTFPL